MSEKMSMDNICNRTVVTATADMNLKEAANLMRSEHVGSLVVVEETASGRAVIGMLTDRDIAIVAVARDFDPQTLCVGDIMSAEVVAARPSDSVNDVLTIMRGRGIRRVPITTDDDVLVGIVTLDDLLDVITEEIRGFVQAIESAQKHEKRVRV